MASEQRIIGAGMLLTGIAVVLILIYFFAFGGTSAQDAHEELVQKIYPAYKKAKAGGDYLAQRRQAEAALALLDDAGQTAVLTRIKADASSGDREALALQKLIEDGVLERNTKDEFKFARGWYSSSEHRALSGLEKSVESLKTVRRVREIARETAGALGQIALGGGAVIELPEAKASDGFGPSTAADAESFRVFGVSTAAVEALLQSPVPPAGRARSARLRWNQSRGDTALADEVASLPLKADELRAAAAQLQAYGQTLGGKAKDAVDRLVKTGLAHAAAGLEGEARQAFEAGRDELASPAGLAKFARGQAGMLQAHTTIRDLAKLLGSKFREK